MNRYYLLLLISANVLLLVLIILVAYMAFGTQKPSVTESKQQSVLNSTKSVSWVPTVLPTQVPTVEVTGKTYYVDPSGKDTNIGTQKQPFKSIQKALSLATAGDVISLAPGEYREDIKTVRDGASDRRITLKGPKTAVLKGGGGGHLMDINHSFITLDGFTVDGLQGNQTQKEGYADKLIYVQGKGVRQGVTGLKIFRMKITNGGGECIRLRYFAQNNEIAYNTIGPCGVHDFKFADGGKNGEAIYIGTAPEQRKDGKNPTQDADESKGNWIHHNNIATEGNECVDIKEGATENIVEYNSCTGQKDPESGGMDSRGEKNTFRNNEIYENVGSGIRLGGDKKTDGIENNVYSNTIRSNKNGGIKVQRIPQGKICGNTMSSNSSGNGVGTYGEKISPAKSCS